jgi:mannose-1-phosphate guanylyltransferase
MRPITPVLLCGGVGSRLWPVSRQGRPKQYLNLIGEQSMLQQTLTRLEGLEQTDPIIVCNDEHRFLVAEQVRQLGIEKAMIILEPEGKKYGSRDSLGGTRCVVDRVRRTFVDIAGRSSYRPP